MFTLNYFDPERIFENRQKKNFKTVNVYVNKWKDVWRNKQKT